LGVFSRWAFASLGYISISLGDNLCSATVV